MTKARAALSESERERYRDRIEGGLGLDGQVRLKEARAIVVGAGTAGAAAAAQLASSGVGYVAIVDGATVALRDLAGQALFYTPDVGRGKADTLTAKLGLLNPEVQVESYPVDVEEQNAAAIVAGHDVVLDCTRDPAVAAALDRTAAGVLRLSADQPSATAAGAALADEALNLLASKLEALA